VNRLPFIKHAAAIVESSCIGEGTRIWAFAHILPGAQIGRDCNICDHTFIENDVVIGDRVTVKCGVQLWDGIRIEDDVFIGPNATFTNDTFPRSRKRPEQVLRTLVKKGASIGANATILPGITIEEDAMIGAGAVITRNVPRNAVVYGNPGRIMGYTNAPDATVEPVLASGDVDAWGQIDVEGVELRHLPLVTDMRGMLSFGEAIRHVPFAVKRYFLVFDVPTEQVRGEHAHRAQHQFLICVHGRCSVMVDDGKCRQEVILDSPRLGLYIPAMTWSVQHKYSRDAVLLALVSDVYDASDYIRDYGEFLALRETTFRMVPSETNDPLE
jgi:acetyltransferase-like isoleucine patch superfamily enzyme